MSRKKQPAQRDPLDRYYTPSWATVLLLHHVPEIGGHTLLDPSCGDGSMAALVGARFERVVRNDIDPAAAAPHRRDARHAALWECTGFDWCVTNPPFSMAGIIALRALDHARSGVAMLLRLSFMECCKGREFLTVIPPCRVLVLPRIKFRGERTDKVTCAWFVWSRRRLSGRPLVSISRAEARRWHARQTEATAAPMQRAA